MNKYKQLAVGEPAPWFRQRNTSNPDYAFDTVGGRYVVMCFFGSARDAAGQAALAFAHKHRAMFDDDRMCFFGISLDPEDEQTGRVREDLPGIRHFWDFDGTVSQLYGALPNPLPEQQSSTLAARRIWIVLDPALSVLAVLEFEKDGAELEALYKLLNSLPPLDSYGGIEMHAPVIILPRIFETELCQKLIGEYEKHGGIESGYMRDQDGKTVGVYNSQHKRRDDYFFEDEVLKRAVQKRIHQKVIPVIKKVHNFNVTRMERYVVGCYDSQSGGHFRPHRDNSSLGTAHRRFALSINLNDDFTGGELVFPEYSSRRYKVPVGAGVIFAGALMHAVTPVVSGRRYAFLPFLYDEAAAAEREKNSSALTNGAENYKAS